MAYKSNSTSLAYNTEACIAVLCISFVVATGLHAASPEAELRRLGVDEATIRELVRHTAANKELKSIDADIKAKKARVEEARAQALAYEHALQQAQKEGTTLQHQLALLERRIGKKKLEITLTQQEQEETISQIKRMSLDIQDKQQEIANRKEQMKDLMGTLWRTSRRTDVVRLLAYASLASFMDEERQLMEVSEELHNVVARVALAKDTLVGARTDLEVARKNLESLGTKLQSQQRALAEDQESNTQLLRQTKSSEAKYQKLLAQLNAEQASVEQDVVKLEETFRKKLEERGQLSNDAVALEWPVPNVGINATFHDADYPYKRVLEHTGIDLRTLKDGKSSNGVLVRAAERGYVVRAKDAGKGYSYVLILHNAGISTLYGHVSAILVKEGDLVTKGQAVALSGGMPGTRGAGPLTTGPHLHFEVRVKGVPVDPLPYLP